MRKAVRQPDMRSRSSLIRYAWLSIAAAIVTIALKGLAYVADRFGRFAFRRR